jgi:hypothetical protein
MYYNFAFKWGKIGKGITYVFGVLSSLTGFVGLANDVNPGRYTPEEKVILLKEIKEIEKRMENVFTYTDRVAVIRCYSIHEIESLINDIKPILPK